MKEMAPKTDVLSIPMSFSKSTHRLKQIPGRCLFVGSNGHANVQGLSWFLTHVWPLLLTNIKRCSLHVCGTVCNEIKRKFQNVYFLGRLDNIEDEYSATELVVVPLFFGSGLKIKLVEALSYGRACVSTSLGVQGLKEFIGKAILVEDTVDGFVESVKVILTDREKRERMESYAREHIFERFAPRKIYRPFLEKILSHAYQKKSI